MMNAYNQVMRVYCKEDGQYYDMVLKPDSVFADVYVIRTVPFLRWWTRTVSEQVDSYSASEVLCGKILPEDLLAKFEHSINTKIKRRRLHQESLAETDKVWSDWSKNK